VESVAGDLIVLDAGTGFCTLGDALMNGPFGRGKGRMTLLLSHMHMDHLIGFPFAIPVHVPGNAFTVYGPANSRKHLEELHEGLVAPAYSPVYKLDNIGADLDFHPITKAPFNIGSARVQARQFPHAAGSQTWGIKLTTDRRSLVYLPDVEYPGGIIHQEVISFARGVDLLIHDAYFTRQDFVPGWGSCRCEDAVALATMAQVRRLILFHHSPDRTDSQIDELVAEQRDALYNRGSNLRIDAAYEGMTIQL
jgi:phosphoribosyl 1,2-cyclic phosphodiesterase